MLTRTLWIVHFIALIGIALWAILDLRFESLVKPLESVFASPVSAIEAVVEVGGQFRSGLLGIMTLTAGGSLALLIVNLFRSNRSTRVRSIASMLAITATIAFWFSLALNHSSLAWQGKRVRISLQIDEFEAIARPLRSDWPERDGSLPGVGPFMAYPFGRPTTLILLQSPLLAGDEIAIAAVEKSAKGAIQLQLSGGEHNDWAEWHPPGSEPQSFIGGLHDPHRLQSCASIGHGWSLVRYRSGLTQR